MCRTLMAAMLAAGVGAALQAAQDPQPPIFKAGVEIVRLDVQVSGSDGAPIRDLKQQEIEIREGGDLRPIVLFQHIEEPAASYREVVRQTVSSEVSTNQGAARGHLYVLVFDQQHLRPGREQRAREAAQRFLDTRLRPGDRAALYSLPGPGPSIPFTANVRLLVSSLASVRGLAPAEETGATGAMTLQEAFQIARGDDLTAQAVSTRIQSTSAEVDATGRLRGEDNPQRFMDSVKEDARSIMLHADARSRQVLSMLADTMRSMRAIEGRKTILLFSEGFDGFNLRREVEDVAAAAAQSYSAIDAIDLSVRTGDQSREMPTTTDPSIGIHDAMTPLGSLAVETSGRLVLDANGRLDAALGSIAAQSQDYYLVGFTPRPNAPDPGSYRRVSVHVRRGGAQVSTRTGFVLDDRTTHLGRRDAIDRALSAPFPQQGLPVSYTTYVVRGSTPGMPRVVVSLEATLPVAPADRLQPADVVFVVKSVSDGRVAASGSDSLQLPDRRNGEATTGLGTYRVQFDLAPGDYVMRAVVREPGGLLGSADRRLTVRALDGPSLSAGDLVFADGADLAVHPAAYLDDGLSGIVPLYARTAEQLGQARVIFDLLAPGDASPIRSGVATLDETAAFGNGLARTARFDLPLAGLAPGPYVARASVKVGADTVAQVEREVDVRAGRRPIEAPPSEEAPFDPRAIAEAAFAKEYVERLSGTGSPALVPARRGLDRLAASDFTGAIAAFGEAMQADEHEGATAFFLGWAFHGAGDDRQAISSWRRAAFVNPRLVPVHLALADMYVRLSQPALAIQALRAGLQSLPQSPELRERLERLEARR